MHKRNVVDVVWFEGVVTITRSMFTRSAKNYFFLHFSMAEWRTEMW